MTFSNTTTSTSKIVWHGSLFANNSLAHVNRELCLQLLKDGYCISFVPTETDEFNSSVDPRFSHLEAIRNLPLDSIDINIRHQWPPDFTPATSGKLVLIQPWEFGSLPKEWITPFSTIVDEVWVPSHFVRECYISSGVPAERVQVVPNGVDCVTFSPDATKLLLKTTKLFRFLFVGGTIQRKGIDLLLGAYHNCFTAADDVCLVIKDMGGSSVYEGQTAREVIERFQQDPAAPEIEYIDRMLTPAEMAGLYTSCHCLVHPYRGEGFGLPIAEAMACGLPPIVTGYGAALDFCNKDNAWLIPATIHRLPKKLIGTRETVDYPWLAEPDFASLCSLMHYAATHPADVSNRGMIACRTIREQFTWEKAAEKASERLQSLVSDQAVSRGALHNQSDCDTALIHNSITDACETAATQSHRGDIDGAIQTLLDQGIKIAPTDPRPYSALTEILIRAGRYQDALEVLPEMPPDAPPEDKHELEAICHCAMGNDSAAHQAAVGASGRPRALVVLGTLAARRGDLQQAETLFRRAISVDPSCGNGWLSLGMLLWGQGKHGEAFETLKRAVTVDPLNREAVQILRDMAERLERQVATVEILKSASQAYPDCRHLALHKTLLLARVGKDATASSACEGFLARFGVDDQVLEVAVEQRKRVGHYDRLNEAGQTSISLCMIVKNEEKNLARCLASAKPAVHELVVVDTGSTDRTVAIATAFGARVVSFPWNGSFADARNHALEQARGAWILALDADEALSAQDHGAIAAAVKAATDRACAYSVLTRNYTTMIHAQGWTANDGSYPLEERAEGWQPSTKVRLFPNGSRFRFRGDVHEMVEPSLREAGIPLQAAPFVVHHYGELEQDPVKQLDKKQRYFEIGMQKLAQQPDDMAAICELAVQAGELGRFAEAIDLWDRVLRRDPEYVEALFNKGYCLMGLQRYDEALVCSRKVMELNPDHKEAALNYGVCELYAGCPQKALDRILPVVKRHREYPLLQALCCVLYACLGQQKEAASLYKVLREQGYAVDNYLQQRAQSLKTQGHHLLVEQLNQVVGQIRAE